MILPRLIYFSRALYRSDFVLTIFRLAQVFKQQQNYLKAEPLFLQSIAITERTVGDCHPHVLNRLRNLADLYERWGQLDKAEKVRQILTERKNKLEKDSVL